MTAFFRWLCQEKRITASPMERVPAPKVPLEQIKPLTPDELNRLLRQPDVSTFTGLRDATFIALLADSGLRLSEATNITLAEVDLRQRAIGIVGKGGRPRVVFFGETAGKYLREYLKRREAEPDELVFISSLGEALCRYTMTTRLRRYGQEAGISGKRVSPHTLRHTFAISWLLGGGDALSLQRLLGHSTQAMTSRYVNFTATDLAKLHRTVSPLDRVSPPIKSSALSTRGRSRRR
jgi:site-specific recombinase XerD